jgi:hypothetical protein
MPEYGYLHMGRITGIDADSGGYLLDSVGLARTSKWGPVPSCVPGLRKGDRVVLGATGTSRDNLIIIAKVGAEFADIADIAGLLDALHSKADVVAIDQLANWSTALESRIAGLETGAGGLDARLDAAEADIDATEADVDALQADSVAQAARLTALETKKVSGGSWYVTEDYQCPGTTVVDNADRMPFAGQVWKVGTDLTLGPDNKHLVINKAGIWRPSFTTRYTVPIRIPSGTAGEGTDRSFHIGVTNRDVGPTNATFESGVTGWINAGGALASSGTQKHSGSLSARLTPDGVSAQTSMVSAQINCAAGQKWSILTWVWFTNAVTTGYTAAINWYNAAGSYISTSLSYVSVDAATWTPVFGTYTAPAGAVKAAAVAILIGTPAAGQVWYLDDVSLWPALSEMSLPEDGWAEVNTGNQHHQTRKVGGNDIPLAVGDKVMLFCYWGGASADRLVFPAGSNRMSLTYVGPT